MHDACLSICSSREKGGSTVVRCCGVEYCSRTHSIKVLMNDIPIFLESTGEWYRMWLSSGWWGLLHPNVLRYCHLGSWCCQGYSLLTLALVLSFPPISLSLPHCVSCVYSVRTQRTVSQESKLLWTFYFHPVAQLLPAVVVNKQHLLPCTFKPTRRLLTKPSIDDATDCNRAVSIPANDLLPVSIYQQKKKALRGKDN